MPIRLLPLLSLTLGFAVACSGGAETPPVAAPPPPPVLPADGSVGVAECDDYIKKMEECIGLSDPTVKPSLEASLKASKESWLLVAGNADTRGTLVASCSAMIPLIPGDCRPGAAPVEGAEPDAGPAGPPKDAAKAAPAEPKPASTTVTPRGMHVPDQGAASMERSRPGSGGAGKKSGGGTTNDDQSGSSSGSSGMGRSRPK